MTLQEVYSQALSNAFWIQQNLPRFSKIDPYALARITTGVAKVESNFSETAKNKKIFLNFMVVVISVKTA
jgi:hypothetical protein